MKKQIRERKINLENNTCNLAIGSQFSGKIRDCSYESYCQYQTHFGSGRLCKLYLDQDDKRSD